MKILYLDCGMGAAGDMLAGALLELLPDPDAFVQELNALGIPASNAITMFYKQIILQRGLPFEVKLPEHPLDVSRLTDAQLDAELEKGYAQYRAGQAVPAQQAFADIRKGLAHEL